MKLKRIVARLRRVVARDSGLGIVEVIVALMIFAVIALGMGYSLASMSRLTAESTNREAAANLAAAEIDRIQSLADPTSVTSGVVTPSPVVNGVTFTITRSVGWVPASGTAGRCGTGGGNLLYKRLNITVTWPAMYLSTPVRTDSALSPSQRINDPAAGTIIVAVKGVGGLGSSGVTVSVTPDAGSTGTTITEAISPTDVDGCTFVLKVDPGLYTVKISRTGYVSSDNQDAGTIKAAQNVTAGSTLALNYDYDLAANFLPKYAANSTRSPAVAPNMPVFFVGDATKKEPTPVAAEKLWAKSNGYTAVAGEFATCASVDPDAWSANATKQDGVRASTVNPGPGETAQIPVPMGVVMVTIPSSDSYVTAVQQSSVAADGNPGCTTPSSFSYNFSTKYLRNTVVPIALPYGNWLLYTGTTAPGAKTTPVASGMTVVDGVVSLSNGTLLTGVPGGGTISGALVTLDPRPLK